MPMPDPFWPGYWDEEFPDDREFAIEYSFNEVNDAEVKLNMRHRLHPDDYHPDAVLVDVPRGAEIDELELVSEMGYEARLVAKKKGAVLQNPFLAMVYYEAGGQAAYRVWVDVLSPGAGVKPQARCVFRPMEMGEDELREMVLADREQSGENVQHPQDIHRAELARVSGLVGGESTVSSIRNNSIV
ncbi:uncharacterized protein BP01DRAFT_367607 [Aspergillus saccharolyticus JOP 1030-1]|uniref:Uncharacterized protein n=1 Tax=Aspergillus saccharolyticus JOP 1030-1 TaxID=1450539 RepID=A0A318Z7J8_9EURO|nr:hypothetical protein BP01DRAFT_367607 [Aspergillus saccharolyticus JOP 1030-1]PYH43099.1 hypothetical protein BP01DRAFT_367607 [Aspergillus saccharolyticus JOP 1030-1]